MPRRDLDAIALGVNLTCASADPRMQPGGCPISRARFKRDIEYVSMDERARLANQVLALPLATRRYREGDVKPEPRAAVPSVSRSSTRAAPPRAASISSSARGSTTAAAMRPKACTCFWVPIDPIGAAIAGAETTKPTPRTRLQLQRCRDS